MSGLLENPVWLLSVPNDRKNALPNLITIATDKAYATASQFKIPELKVGTLDSLMTMTDDLTRVDISIIQIISKIARQYEDIGGSASELNINGASKFSYIANFKWDEAKFAFRKPLNEIVTRIQEDIGRMDEEFRALSSQYTEIKSALNVLTRKKGNNLNSGSLEEILRPEIIDKVTGGKPKDEIFINTDFLKTTCVVIKVEEELNFKNSYEGLGDKSISIVTGKGASNVLTCPVVPRSAMRIIQDDEGYVLYTVVVLAKFYPQFKQACQTSRYNVREFNASVLDEKQISVEEKISLLEVDENRLNSGLKRWCRPHFTDAFIALVHIKAIRLFAESVLRYGLPVNFVSISVNPIEKHEKKIRENLFNGYSHLGGAFAGVVGVAEGQEENALKDIGFDDGNFYPYDTLCPGLVDGGTYCNGNGVCDFSTGICMCSNQFQGTECGDYRCASDCNVLNSQGICDTTSGLCSCASGFSGTDCSIVEDDLSVDELQRIADELQLHADFAANIVAEDMETILEPCADCEKAMLLQSQKLEKDEDKAKEAAELLSQAVISMNAAAEEKKLKDQNNFESLKIIYETSKKSYDDNLETFSKSASDVCSKASDSSVPDVVMGHLKLSFSLSIDSARNAITKMEEAKSHYLNSLKHIIVDQQGNVDSHIRYTEKAQSSASSSKINYSMLQKAADASKAVSNKFPLNDDIRDSARNAQTAADRAYEAFLLGQDDFVKESTELFRVSDDFIAQYQELNAQVQELSTECQSEFDDIVKRLMDAQTTPLCANKDFNSQIIDFYSFLFDQIRNDTSCANEVAFLNSFTDAVSGVASTVSSVTSYVAGTIEEANDEIPKLQDNVNKLQEIADANPSCSTCVDDVNAANDKLASAQKQVEDASSHLATLQSNTVQVTQETIRAPCKQAVLSDISSAIVLVNTFQQAILSGSVSTSDDIQNFISSLRDQVNQIKLDTSDLNCPGSCGDSSDSPTSSSSTSSSTSSGGNDASSSGDDKGGIVAGNNNDSSEDGGASGSSDSTSSTSSNSSSSSGSNDASLSGGDNGGIVAGNNNDSSEDGGASGSSDSTSSTSPSSSSSSGGNDASSSGDENSSPSSSRNEAPTIKKAQEDADKLADEVIDLQKKIEVAQANGDEDAVAILVSKISDTIAASTLAQSNLQLSHYQFDINDDGDDVYVAPPVCQSNVLSGIVISKLKSSLQVQYSSNSADSRALVDSAISELRASFPSGIPLHDPHVIALAQDLMDLQKEIDEATSFLEAVQSELDDSAKDLAFLEAKNEINKKVKISTEDLAKTHDMLQDLILSSGSEVGDDPSSTISHRKTNVVKSLRDDTADSVKELDAKITDAKNKVNLFTGQVNNAQNTLDNAIVDFKMSKKFLEMIIPSSATSTDVMNLAEIVLALLKDESVTDLVFDLDNYQQELMDTYAKKNEILSEFENSRIGFNKLQDQSNALTKVYQQTFYDADDLKQEVESLLDKYHSGAFEKSEEGDVLKKIHTLQADARLASADVKSAEKEANASLDLLNDAIQKSKELSESLDDTKANIKRIKGMVDNNMQAIIAKTSFPESFDKTCFVIIVNGVRESILDSRTGDLIVTLQEKQEKLQAVEKKMLKLDNHLDSAEAEIETFRKKLVDADAAEAQGESDMKVNRETVSIMIGDNASDKEVEMAQSNFYNSIEEYTNLQEAENDAYQKVVDAEDAASTLIANLQNVEQNLNGAKLDLQNSILNLDNELLDYISVDEILASLGHAVDGSEGDNVSTNEGDESDSSESPTSSEGPSDSKPTSSGGDSNPTSSGGDTNPTSSGGDSNPTSSGGDTNPTSSGGDNNPTSSGGDSNPTSSGGDTTPTSSGGESNPTSSGGDTNPTSSGGDTTPTSSGGDSNPTSSGGDSNPTSSGGDTTPTSSGADSNPTSRGGSGDRNPTSSASDDNSVGDKVGSLSCPGKIGDDVFCYGNGECSKSNDGSELGFCKCYAGYRGVSCNMATSGDKVVVSDIPTEPSSSEEVVGSENHESPTTRPEPNPQALLRYYIGSFNQDTWPSSEGTLAGFSDEIMEIVDDFVNRKITASSGAAKMEVDKEFRSWFIIEFGVDLPFVGDSVEATSASHSSTDSEKDSPTPAGSEITPFNPITDPKSESVSSSTIPFSGIEETVDPTILLRYYVGSFNRYTWNVEDGSLDSFSLSTMRTVDDFVGAKSASKSAQEKMEIDNNFRNWFIAQYNMDVPEVGLPVNANDDTGFKPAYLGKLVQAKDEFKKAEEDFNEVNDNLQSAVKEREKSNSDLDDLKIKLSMAEDNLKAKSLILKQKQDALDLLQINAADKVLIENAKQDIKLAIGEVAGANSVEMDIINDIAKQKDELIVLETKINTILELKQAAESSYHERELNVNTIKAEVDDIISQGGGYYNIQKALIDAMPEPTTSAPLTTTSAVLFDAFSIESLTLEYENAVSTAVANQKSLEDLKPIIMRNAEAKIRAIETKMIDACELPTSITTLTDPLVSALINNAVEAQQYLNVAKSDLSKAKNDFNDGEDLVNHLQVNIDQIKAGYRFNSKSAKVYEKKSNKIEYSNLDDANEQLDKAKANLSVKRLDLDNAKSNLKLAEAQAHSSFKALLAAMPAGATFQDAMTSINSVISFQSKRAHLFPNMNGCASLQSQLNDAKDYVISVTPFELLDKIASADKDQQQIVDTAERLAAAKVSSTFDHHGDNNGNDGEVENKADPLALVKSYIGSLPSSTWPEGSFELQFSPEIIDAVDDFIAKKVAAKNLSDKIENDKRFRLWFIQTFGINLPEVGDFKSDKKYLK